MKKLTIAIIVIFLIFGALFVWYRYFRQEEVVINQDTVETLKDSEVVVKKDTISEDIDSNISEIEKEIDSIDLDKELADFNDINW